MDDGPSHEPLSTTVGPGVSHLGAPQTPAFGRLESTVVDDDPSSPLEVPTTGINQRAILDAGSSSNTIGKEQFPENEHYSVGSFTSPRPSHHQSNPSGEQSDVDDKRRLHHFRISSSKPSASTTDHVRVKSVPTEEPLVPTLIIHPSTAPAAIGTSRRQFSGGSQGDHHTTDARTAPASDCDSARSTAGDSRDLEVEVEHDAEDDLEELATYKAKKYAQLNNLNRMAGLMVVMLICAFILGIAALVSEEWYVYKVSHDYDDGRVGITEARDTFAIFTICFEGDCDAFSKTGVALTENFFPQLFVSTNSSTAAPSSVCQLGLNSAHGRRDATQAFAVLYMIGIGSAAILSVAVNMRPTLERTQALITCVCLACIVAAAMPVFAIFGATFIQPLLLCGKGLCEYAEEYTLPAGVARRKCTSSAVYGLWLFVGSNCACVVALLINLRIIHMLVHIKMETRKQMHNLRQHRVEAYLYQCIRDAEDNDDRGEVKQLRHMLGVVAGVKTDASTDPFGIMGQDAATSSRVKTPRSTLAPRDDRIQFDDVNPENEPFNDTVNSSRKGRRTMRLTRRQLVATNGSEEEMRDASPRQPIIKHMGGVSDWLYDNNSQLFYSYNLGAFWDPLCREFYDESSKSWVHETAFLEGVRLRRLREPEAVEDAAFHDEDTPQQ